MSTKTVEKAETKSEDQKEATYRCCCCKREMKLLRFYASKGIIDRFKCRSCYSAEFKQLLRDHPL